MWAGPLTGGARAVVLFNRQFLADSVKNHSMALPWSLLGYSSLLQVCQSFADAGSAAERSMQTHRQCMLVLFSLQFLGDALVDARHGADLLPARLQQLAAGVPLLGRAACVCWSWYTQCSMQLACS